MNFIFLNGQWHGKCFAEDNTIDFCFEGTVPGCAHTDLRGNKIPADIFYRDQADQCTWIENRDFEYSRSFEMHSLPTSAKLVFEGLDVYTDVYLNGRHIGSTDNMFIPHSFDVSDVLRKGENEISVYFHSPIKKVEGLPLCRGAFTRERMHTRRIQCTYGWDWVGRFVTCGIFKDVYISCADGFQVKDAYIYCNHASKDYASVVVEAEFEGFENGGYADMEIVSPNGETVYSHRFYVKEESLKAFIDIPDPMLWYPSGYGEQPIYQLIICNKKYSFGIRTARVVELPDAKGSSYYEKCLELKNSVSSKEYDRNEEFSGFQLLINDVPILCQGANWVPSEPFISEETDEKITTLLELAKEANLNMLRVWGGGIFEKQHFYNECDRLGILVTQDFLMACGQYPEKDPSFIAQIRKETEFAARALRNHPSLVWWSGDNENAVLGFDDAEDYTGRTVIHQGIYPILKRLDPHRRFFPSSPYGGVPYASKTKGTTHNTQYLGCSIFPYIREEDMQDYKEHFSQYLARFVAEEPTLGAIGYPSLKRFMTEDDIFNRDEMWNYHTKNNPGLPFTIMDVLHDFTQKVLGKYKDGKDRFFKLKYAQYEWVRISMENIRRNSGFANGVIYWMWNDCWPASAGWAFVDYYCIPKASFYSFKRCAKPITASVERGDAYDIYVCNQATTVQKVTLSVYCVQNGTASLLARLDHVAAANTASKAFSLPLSALADGAMLVCDVIGEIVCDRAFYKNGALPIIPSNALRVISKTDQKVTVSADAYVHAVELEGECIFEDNYFSLLPGECKTVSYRPAKSAQTTEITTLAYTVDLSQNER